jgi:L-alanine-DL-glutamate epimerase-like enolase superfamily enzyme
VNDNPSLRISGVDCDVLVVPDCDQEYCDTAQDNALVRVYSDSGVTGIGEVESNPWVIKALFESPSTNAYNRSLTDCVLGLDLASPQELWDRLYRETFLVGRRGAGICALGALDMAVWDLYGRAAGEPVWRLLGGEACHSHVTPYASLLPSGRTLKQYRESLLAKAAWAVEAGFRAVKMEILLQGAFSQYGLQEGDDAIVDLVAAGRETVGSQVGLIIDVGYCWSDWKQAARVFRRLEKYDLFFVETPLMPDDLEGYACLRGAVGIPVAAGELLQTRFEFQELMDRGAVDVVQPDVGRVGGLTEAYRVVKMAAERGNSSSRTVGRAVSEWLLPLI